MPKEFKDGGEISTEELDNISSVSKSFEYKAMEKCSKELIYGDFIKTHTISINDIKKITEYSRSPYTMVSRVEIVPTIAPEKRDAGVICNNSVEVIGDRICLRNFRTTIPREYIDTITIVVNGSHSEIIYYDVYEAYLHRDGISPDVSDYIPISVCKFGFPILKYTGFSIKIKFNLNIIEKEIDMDIDAETGLVMDTGKMKNTFEICCDVHNMVDTFTDDVVQYEMSYTLNNKSYGHKELFDHCGVPLYHFSHDCHMSKFYIVKTKNVMNVGDQLTLRLAKETIYYTYKIYVTKVYGNLAIFELPTFLDLSYFYRCFYYDPNSEIIDTYAFMFQAMMFGSGMTSLLYTQ